jgi:transaldolase
LRGSLESAREHGGVSPELAHDSAATAAEATRLWSAIDRPNLMVKVPATPAGIPVIQELTAGINVNITLLFGARPAPRPSFCEARCDANAAFQAHDVVRSALDENIEDAHAILPGHGGSTWPR